MGEAGPAGILSRDGGWWKPSSDSPSALLKSVRTIFFSFIYLFFGGSHLCTPWLPNCSKWTPSSHSPSTTLKSTSISKNRASATSCDSVFMTAIQEMPLDHLALKAGGRGLGGLCSWVCNNCRNSFWRTTTPRALHRKQTETHPLPPPVFLRKGPICLCRNFAWGAGFWFSIFVEPIEVLSENGGHGCISIFSFCLATDHWIFQKGANSFVWSSYFCSSCLRTLLYIWLW